MQDSQHTPPQPGDLAAAEDHAPATEDDPHADAPPGAEPSDADEGTPPPPAVAATPHSGPVLDPLPRVVLEALSGPEDGRLFRITGGIAVIGRHEPDLAVALPLDAWLSRRHAQLTYREGRWWLQDLGSSNGTWLDHADGPLTVEQPIALGQVFRVGHTDLRLTDDPTLLARAAELV